MSSSNLPLTSPGFTDAAVYGFSPDASGLNNAHALQRALDTGGTVVVSRPGTYQLAATVYIGSHTSLVCGNNVFFQKVDEAGPFCHVLLNKGALTRTYDHNITVEGLHLLVNGVDHHHNEVYGLRGQLSFFYVKDLCLKRFRCLDLGSHQFCLQICTFEDVLIDDVIIKGDKDGVHFGRGKRFAVRNGVFDTYDDAIALNAQDYSVSNPELGWIEGGIIENCHDLYEGKPGTGFFCRFLAGAWLDWYEGMEVRRSDTIAHEGRLYRVQTEPNGTRYRSLTPPTHGSGQQEIDGITWGWVQPDVIHTAGVRNVVFRDIFLHKPRIAFAMLFDDDRFNRSYYPGAPLVPQGQLTLENVHVLYENPVPLVLINCPVDAVTLSQAKLRNNSIQFHQRDLKNPGTTCINMTGCTFAAETLPLLTNEMPDKRIILKTTGSMALHEGFVASVEAGPGSIRVESDLPGLNTDGYSAYLEAI